MITLQHRQVARAIVGAFLLGITACGVVETPRNTSQPVPEWARVSAAQREEARKLGLPVAIQDKRTGIRLLLVPGTKRRSAFYMGMTEVTNAQFRAFRSDHVATFPDDDQPADSISYLDAKAFADWLSPTTRLPTEDEWVHVRKAATNTTPTDWKPAHPAGHTHPVTQRPPNDWGFHGMLDNLFEWCEPAWKPSRTSRRKATTRGGSWRYRPARVEHWVDHGDPDTGFRIVQELSR